MRFHHSGRSEQIKPHLRFLAFSRGNGRSACLQPLIANKKERPLSLAAPLKVHGALCRQTVPVHSPHPLSGAGLP